MSEKIKKILYLGGPLNPIADMPREDSYYEFGVGKTDWFTWLILGLIIGIPLIYFLIKKIIKKSKN